MRALREWYEAAKLLWRGTPVAPKMATWAELRALCDRVHGPAAPCAFCKPSPRDEFSNDPMYLRERYDIWNRESA